MPTTYDHTLKTLHYRTRKLEWLLLSAGLLVLGFFLAVWQVGEQQAAREREYSRLMTQTGIVYNDLRRQLMSIRASHFNLQAELLEGNGDFDQVKPFIDKRLRAFVQTITGVRTVTLIDAGGQILASSDPLKQQGSLRDNVLVQRVMTQQQAGTLFISTPYSVTENLHTIAVASALTGWQGEFAGLVVTELNPAELGTLLDTVVYAADMQAIIAHANGKIVLSRPGDGQEHRNPARLDGLLLRHVQSGQDISVEGDWLLANGQASMVVQQSIQPAELNISDALIVAVSRQHGAVFAVTSRDARLISTLYLLLTGFGVLALYVWQRKSRRVFRELQETQQQVMKNNAQLLRLNRQLEQQTENMRSLAFLDELTNLANRRHFNRSLDAEWRRCQREELPLSLIMLDVDYFKQFNDLYGHQRGDECLARIAASLKNSLTRSHDLPARIGGEEFACLLPNTPLKGALIKAERIRAEIEALAIPHAGSPAAPVVTVSVGVASAMPRPGNDSMGLTEAADQALYRAKSRGRNQACSPPDEHGKTY